MLGLVYLGGWWVFGLAAVAALLALHEFWVMARALAPLAPAGYVGAGSRSWAPSSRGIEWMVGGVLIDASAGVLPEAVSRGAPGADGGRLDDGASARCGSVSGSAS